MDTGSSTAPCKSGEEEGGAGGGFEGGGSAEIVEGGEVEDEHVLGLETFFLDARRGEVDVITVLDGYAAAGALWGGLSKVMWGDMGEG